MAIDPVALKNEVVTLLTDAEDVLNVVAEFDHLPGLSVVAPFVTEAQTVLKDVLEFLAAV